LPAAGVAAGAALAIAAGLTAASLAAVVDEGDSLFEQPLNAAAAHRTTVPVEAPNVLHVSNLPECQAMTVSVFQVMESLMKRVLALRLKRLKQFNPDACQSSALAGRNP
jgi:hypothetical protein